jgi:uncharacterized protein
LYFEADFHIFIIMKTSKEIQIIHLTDIHGAGFLIDEIASDLQKADLVIISGDITHFGKEKETSRILERIENYNKNILAITGNCDFPEVQKFIEIKGINIHRVIKEAEGLSFIGISGSLPCPGKTPNEYSENQVEEWLNEIESNINASDTLIFVSHQPPVNTLNDMVCENTHVGSIEIRKYIEKNKPVLCLTGHIHEGIGIDSIGKCKIVNPGPFRTGKYAVININNDGSTLIELKQIKAK